MAKKSKESPAKWGKGMTDPDTWWKKGEPSPNPKGRPKGSKNQKTIWNEASSIKVEVNIDGKTLKMPKKEVKYHQLNDKAAAGDTKAIAMANELDAKFDPVEAVPPQHRSLPPTIRRLRSGCTSRRSSRCSRLLKRTGMRSVGLIRTREAGMADPFELRGIVDDLCRRDFFAFAIRRATSRPTSSRSPIRRGCLDEIPRRELSALPKGPILPRNSVATASS